MKTISGLVSTLCSHPDLIGLVEYGSQRVTAPCDTGDYDLFAIVTTPVAPITSLHFMVGTTPVDLSVMTWEALQACDVLYGFDAVLLEGRLICDPTARVQRELDRLRATTSVRPAPLSAATIAFIRHGHRHTFDKVRGRIASMPSLCHLLLATNVYWLLENYFRVRSLPYRGEKAALAYLADHDPPMLQWIDAFYQTTDLHRQFSLGQEMTNYALAPIGGMWNDHEVLTFGDHEAADLAVQGTSLFQHFFGSLLGNEGTP